jgi:ADP-ribose pyrophosphatase
MKTKQELIYQGKVIRLMRETFYMGGQRLVREVILHPGAAVIVPLLEDRRVVMVRQYRRAAGKTLLELPAGTLTPGEPPVQCARRELEEETGWRAKTWRRISSFYAAPGMFSEWMVVFLAIGLTKARAHPEPDEILTPVILPLRTALAKITTGEICDAKSIIGLRTVEQMLKLTQRACSHH